MNERMQATEKHSAQLEDALSSGVLKRLPLTFLPFVNQQLGQWEYLFPNERNSVERLLIHIASLKDDESSALFRDIVALEHKMGVRDWQFSTTEQTIENSSELARSPYFQEWRRAVQAVFDAADRSAQQAQKSPEAPRHRLVLLELPRALPLNAAKVWRPWQGIGRIVELHLNSASAETAPLATLLRGTPPEVGLLDAAQNRSTPAHAETWVIDAGRELIDSIATHDYLPDSSPVLLSYSRLDSYRENFSREMNTMRKDLADADAVWNRLRKVDVGPWCPPEVVTDAAIREFVRSLFLSGNGAVIFGNSFVEWAASEAFRRARPSLLAARFGVRSKPKPFTGVAVFENPDQVNPLLAVDDLEGSAIDAQMLALYVWLAAGRYDEYQRSTLCICIAESLSQAYVVAPPEFNLEQGPRPLPLEHLGRALHNWITQI
jgi:hypothetical protein